MELTPHQPEQEHGSEAQTTPEEAIQLITNKMAGLDEESVEYKSLGNLKNSIEVTVKNLEFYVKKREDDDFFRHAEMQLDDKGDVQSFTDDYGRKIAHLELTLRTYVERAEELCGDTAQVSTEVDPESQHNQGMAAYILGRLRRPKKSK